MGIGSVFPTRHALHDAGVHAPPRAGISGTGAEGADSVVLSGGNPDDADYGDVIVYAGHGGTDPATGRQVADQDEHAHGNAALITSQLEGLPVRVVRGAGGHSQHAPVSGFRYDGLYRVTDHWLAAGRHGHRVMQFRLERIEEQPHVPLDQLDLDGRPAALGPTAVQRQSHTSAAIAAVKALHGHRCQVCGEALAVHGGRYAEGAHLRPLERPHLGPDSPDNVLCLCPNHHVRFDCGGLYLTDALDVVDAATGTSLGPLRTHPQHPIDGRQVAYHRSLWVSPA